MINKKVATAKLGKLNIPNIRHNVIKTKYMINKLRLKIKIESSI